MPYSPRSKQPTSSVGPYRFLTARTMRSRECRSPSKCSTTSTRCSSVRGPATEPSLVTCPTRIVAIARSLATAVSARGDLAYLGDAAGHAVDLAGRDGLHRVDDQQVRADAFDVCRAIAPRSVSAAR